jgi:tetratricopeptide (TPR) repeat protein
MRKTIPLWTLTLLASLCASTAMAGAANSLRKPLWLAPVRAWHAPPAAAQAKQPQWKSTEEYNASTAMKTEADPNKRLSLAEAFLQKFPNSDFKDAAYVAMITAYQQLGDAPKMHEASRKAIDANPDNVDALFYGCVSFPYVFKAADPNAAQELSQSERDARHGLEILQKVQKPANLTDEQFTQYVKAVRATFNNTIALVALQKKDYAAAIASLKAASEDTPSDFTTFYRLGLAYWYSSPPDYDHAAWYMARSTSLARAAKNAFETEVMKDLKRLYVNYHGTDQGLEDMITQAASSVNPPEGFKVTPMETPKPTGNRSIDGFNQTFFQLKLGGERAQKLWDSLKGEPFGAAGFVESVEKGAEPGTYVVRIDILEASKAAEGVYDIELKDSTQANVKNLSKGDGVHFQGKIESYTATPNLVVTLGNGKINEDEIPEHPKVAPKPKPKPKAAPARRPARKTPT